MRGILYATLSSVFLASGFVVSKKVLSDLNPETFIVLWFQFAFLFSGVYAWISNKENLVRSFFQSWRPFVAIGVLNAFAAMAFFNAIKLTDPTLVALFNRSEAIYTVLFGIAILREKLNKIEVVGIVITIIGTTMITYNAGGFVFLGLLLVLASAFFFSLGSIIAKIVVSDANYVAMVGFRGFFTALGVLLFSLVFRKLEIPSMGNLAFILCGAFLGPFLGMGFFYYSLTFIDVSKVAVLRSTTPLFVALFAFLLLGILPEAHQMLGGLIVIIGVSVLTVSHEAPRLPQIE
ncbi:MAG: DMT family transporter [bacterium]